MTVVGAYEDDDYWPEFGTLIVSDDGAQEETGPFSRLGSKVQPCGTVVRTGYGWLEAAAGDGPHVIRVEVHDSAPDDDLADWEDVVEIPYRSTSGTIGLGYVTGGFCGDVFTLPAAGDYRVLVTRRQLDEPEDLWRLRFRPAEPAPPRWFRRRAAAVPPPDPGWRTLFTSDVNDLLWALEAAQDETGATTEEALRQWGERHRRTSGWLDKSLSKPVAHQVAAEEVARQLGRPAPATLGDMLDLFVAVGVLVDDGGYREPAVPPNPEDVLDLPSPRQVVARRENGRFCSFAADLVSVAVWGGTEQTLAGLAERTLAPADDVRATLEWAVRGRLLQVTGPLDGSFTMAVGPAAG